jgi:hypothetical protein
MILFPSLPAALTVRKHVLFIAASAFALLIVTPCSSRHAPSLTTLALKYRPMKIATNVPAEPGSIAWSHDGRTLAFVKHGMVNLYDAVSGEGRSRQLEGAHFVCWSPTDSLLVLAYEKGEDVLCTIDRKSLDVTTTPVAAGAAAVYPADDNRHLIILAKNIRKFSYGTEISLQVSSHENVSGTQTPLYAFSKIYPMDRPDLRAMLAWTHAGLNPLDNSLLIIEHIKPPVVTPYSRVIMIDPVSKESTEISGRMRDTIYASASWSPDGNMLALTRADGSLEIRTLRNKKIILDQRIAGYYPTWSPQGDRVYIGGHLIRFDGKEPEVLLSNAAWSIAAWSPDNTTLAVSADGDLWLFRDLMPASNQPDGMHDRILLHKMLLLQDLLRDKLITLQEYQERKNSLLKRSEAE